MKLELYTTLGCHLCEKAMVLLLQAQQDRTFDIIPIEIADSDELMDRYGIRIPVIKIQSTDQELGWPFNIEDLQQFLNLAE